MLRSLGAWCARRVELLRVWCVCCWYGCDNHYHAAFFDDTLQQEPPKAKEHWPHCIRCGYCQRCRIHAAVPTAMATKDKKPNERTEP